MNPRSATTGQKRPKLDRDTVVSAAVALADAEGIDALTIRRLAQRLSVTPMALYWHFSDKDALLAAAGDRLWEEALGRLDAAAAAAAGEKGRGAGEDPWAPFRATLGALVQVMRAHPALAGLMSARALGNDAGLTVTERTLAFLAERGLDRSSAFLVAHIALDSAVMLVQNEPGTEVFDPEKRAEAIHAKSEFLATLPAERYPHVVASADFLSGIASDDEYFEQSIALIVAAARFRE